MMMMSGNFTPESQMSSCDEPRGIGYWNLWGFMNAHKPLFKKTTQEHRRWQESDREGPNSRRVSRITGQDALTLLPKGFAQTIPWNCDYFRHTSEPTVSAIPSVSYKINYTDQWRPLPQRQRKNKADDNTITRIYKAPMRITSTKWQHLQKLKKVLPKDNNHCYDALPHGDWILNTGTLSVLIPRLVPLDIKGTCSAV